jgi:hypothetical protein
VARCRSSEIAPSVAPGASCGIMTTKNDEPDQIRARVEAEVLALFRDCYHGDESTAEILDTDPNDFDLDPSMFYELLEDRFGVPQDPANTYFGGYGGTVEATIEFLAARWDGVLHDVGAGEGTDEDEDADDE